MFRKCDLKQALLLIKMEKSVQSHAINYFLSSVDVLVVLAKHQSTVMETLLQNSTPYDTFKKELEDNKIFTAVCRVYTRLTTIGSLSKHRLLPHLREQNYHHATNYRQIYVNFNSEVWLFFFSFDRKTFSTNCDVPTWPVTKQRRLNKFANMVISRLEFDNWPSELYKFILSFSFLVVCI